GGLFVLSTTGQTIGASAKESSGILRYGPMLPKPCLCFLCLLFDSDIPITTGSPLHRLNSRVPVANRLASQGKIELGHGPVLWKRLFGSDTQSGLIAGDGLTQVRVAIPNGDGVEGEAEIDQTPGIRL